jgi:hypothetical protein
MARGKFRGLSDGGGYRARLGQGHHRGEARGDKEGCWRGGCCCNMAWLPPSSVDKTVMTAVNELQHGMAPYKMLTPNCFPLDWWWLGLGGPTGACGVPP